MRTLLTLCLAVAVSAAAAEDKKDPAKKEAPVVPPREGKTETVTLFDGKTLDGWEGYSDLWSVKDGVIVAKNTDPLKFSTYLLTKNKYSDFRLTFAAKLLPGSEMHSGVAFWGAVKPEVSKEPKKERSEYTYAGHLVMFPSGYGMYDLFGRNGLPVDGGPAKKVGKQHDWNDIEVLAQGNRVRVAINGAAVVDWRDPQPERIKEGPIGLQLHSLDKPQELHFKGLVIETFPTRLLFWWVPAVRPNRRPRMSESMTVDPALQEKLATANGHGVTLCDPAGNVVALALPLDQIRRYEIELAKARVRAADIDRVLASPGGHSMEEVHQLLEQP